jgi:dienelactone hydrolase
MNEYKNNSKIAVLVLHEIYGVNRFMDDVCKEYHRQGFDVFCPNLLRRECFSYSEVSEAYDYFRNEVGFEIYKEMEQLIKRLKLQYEQVFVVGFSVGATVAWRCCENLKCDGMICCYGSRIRDYLDLQPCCPVLLLFAEQDSFEVDRVISQLQRKLNVEIHKLKAHHGFLDPYSEYFEKEQTEISKKYITDFFMRYAKVSLSL